MQCRQRPAAANQARVRSTPRRQQIASFLLVTIERSIGAGDGVDAEILTALVWGAPDTDSHWDEVIGQLNGLFGDTLAQAFGHLWRLLATL